MTHLERMEAQLGTHLQKICNALDLQTRQGDTEILEALQNLTEVWQDVALLMGAERKAAITRAAFVIQPGESVVDALMESAVHWFPRSATATRFLRVQG